jgi:hypothetical protein
MCPVGPTDLRSYPISIVSNYIIIIIVILLCTNYRNRRFLSFVLILIFNYINVMFSSCLLDLLCSCLHLLFSSPCDFHICNRPLSYSVSNKVYNISSLLLLLICKLKNVRCKMKNTAPFKISKKNFFFVNM